MIDRKKIKGRRILALLLTLSLAVGNVPALGAAVYADTESSTIHEHETVDTEIPDEAGVLIETPEGDNTEAQNAGIETASLLEGEVSAGEAHVATVTAGDSIKYFTTLETALAYANGAGTATVVLDSADKILLKDETATVGENVTLEIAEYTTLLIPYKKADGTDHDSYDGEGGPADIASWNNTSVDLLDHSLIVDGKIKIDKGANLEVAGVTGYAKNVAYQGMTCGRYGEIVLNSNASIDVYGTLFVNGHVRGSGVINVMSGANMYEPLIILDSPGGSILQMVYETEFPITRYALNSVECKTEINYGATVWGRGKLYGEINGTPQFVSSNVKMIGTSDSLINMKTGAKVITTTDKSVKADHDMPVKKCVVTKGVNLGEIELSALGYGLSSKNKMFPVPYNFQLELRDGNYEITNGVYAKLLPGQKTVIGENATLNVESGGKLLVYDGLMLGDPTSSDNAFPDRVYPRPQELQANGLSAAGQIILDGGTLKLKNGSMFAGLIQNTGSGTVIVEEGVELGTPEGYMDGYSTVRGSNDTKLELDAKFWNGLAYEVMQAGITYNAYGGSAGVRSFKMTGFQTEYWKERSVKQVPADSWIAYPKAESRQGTWNLQDITVTESDACKNLTVQTSNDELFAKGLVKTGSDIKITVELNEGITGPDGGAPTIKGAVLDGEQSGNGVYVYTIENVSTPVNIAVTDLKDTVAPKGTITVADKSWKEYHEDGEIKVFFNTKEEVTITASDIGTGLAEVAYTTSNARILKQAIEINSNIQWTQLDPAADKWTFSFNDIESVKDKTEVTENIFVFVRIKDKSGNVTYVSSEGMALDTVKPAITVNNQPIAKGDVYYSNRYAVLTARASDTNLDYIQVNSGEKQYGVKSVDLTAQDNLDDTYVITAVDKAGNKYVSPAFHYVNPCTVTFMNDGTELSKRNYEYGQTVTVPAVKESYIDEETQTAYSFKGWGWTDAEGDHYSKTIPAVSGSVVYTALYEATGYKVTVPAAADGRYEVTDNGNGFISAGGTYTLTVSELIEGSVCYFDVTAEDLSGKSVEITEKDGTYTIADQGKAIVVKVTAVKHVEETATVDVTCKAPGSITTTCSNKLADGSSCGWSKVEVIPQLGHVTKASTTPATCQKEGYASGVCELCNEEVTGEVLPKLEHKYELVQDESTAATCHSEGLSVYECTTCDPAVAAPVRYEVVEPATGAHALVEHSALEPTCTSDGHNKYYTCNNSGCDYNTKVVLPKKGHDYIETETSPTCTVDGYITKSCKNCTNSTVEFTEELKKLGHDKVIDEAVEATCTKTGLTEGAHCSRCGYVYAKQIEVPKKDHTYVETVKEATCTQTGLKTEICSVCGDTKEEELPVLGHKWSSWTETKAPECLTAGEEQKECSVCHEIETQEVKALGHNMVTDKAVEPTCSNTGLTAGEHCSRCDDVTVKQEIVDAKGHKKEEIPAIAATCKKDGATAGEKCSVCGEILKAPEVIPAGHKYEKAVTEPTCEDAGFTEFTCTVCGHFKIGDVTDPLGHDYELVYDKASKTHKEVCTRDKVTGVTADCTFTSKVTKEPTCSKEGEKTFTCTVCEGHYTEAVGKLAHTPVKDEAVASTCTMTGLTEGSHCEVCGEIIVAQTVVEMLPHEWSGWETTTAPTCTATGIARRDCGVCSLFETKDVDALGHTAVVDEAVAPTCDKTGLTEGSHCSVCNYTITAQETVKALGHKWDEGTITKEPTCDDAGIRTLTCETCGNTKTEEIESKGHNYTSSVVEPTCEEKGYTIHTCDCGDSYKDTYVDALDHDIIVDEAVAATCDNTGLTKGSHCSRCDDATVEQTVVPALGHDYTSKVTKAATCTEDGIRTYTCQNDNSHTYTKAIEAPGHDLMQYEGKAATCTESGWEAYEECIRGNGCNYSTYKEIPATGHSYGKAWEYDADSHWHACHCGDIKDKAAHDFKWVTDLEPTEDAEGKKHEECECGAQGETAAIDKLDHTHDMVKTDAVSATCTKDGNVEYYTCSKCGLIYEDEAGTKQLTKKETVIAATDHDYKGVVTTEPTCTEKGVKTFICQNDKSHTYTETVAALGHKEEKIPAVAATCENEGSTEGTKCSVCKEILKAPEQVKALGHDYKGVITTEPTCTKEGVKTFTCQNDANHVYTEAVAALGHTKEVIPAVAATCDKDGLTEGTKCSVCKEILKAPETVQATGHDYKGVVTTEPTCTEKGVKTFTCQNDKSHTYTEEVTELGHTKETIPAVAATCDKDGSTEGIKCSVCKEIMKAPETVKALGHKYDAGVVTTEPTCTEKGVKTFTCQNDKSHIYTEAVAELGHTKETIPAVAATCDKDGYTEGTKCSVCKEILKAPEMVEALGHKYDEGIVTKEPTVEEAGIRTFTCGICNGTYTEEIPKVDIKTVYQQQLKENIAAAVPSANASLVVEGKQLVTIGTEGEQIEMIIEDPAYPAFGMLMDVDFMSQLFNFREIKHIEIGRMGDDGTADESTFIDYVLNRNPYAGITGSDQFNLMFNAAYAALGGDMTVAEFNTYLRSQVADLTLDAMDGSEIAIRIHAVAADGTEYYVDYTMEFYNRYHQLLINYVDQNDDVVETAVNQSLAKGTEYSHSVPSEINNDLGSFVKADGEPADLSGTMAKEDIIINVKFLNQAKQIDVTYQLEGEGEVVRSEVIGSKFWIPEEREGYTFSGWTTKSGEAVPETVPAGGLTLTGKYVANDYTITYVIKNTETGVETQYDVQTVKYGDVLELKTYTPEKGWSVGKWLQRNGNGAPLTMPANNMELVAEYSPNEYKLNFILNGEAYEGYPQNVKYGTNITAPVFEIKDGWTFSGWKLEDGSVLPQTMPDKNVTAVATYKINEYTVTFDIEGKETKVTYEHGELLEAHQPAAEKAEDKTAKYVFDKWLDENGQQVWPTDYVRGDMKLIAKFRAIPKMYDIKFVVDGNETVKSVEYSTNLAETASEISTLKASDNEAVYTWKFAGWKNADGKIVDLAAEEVTEGAVYTAAYEKVYKNYIVKFIVDGEETSGTYHYGDAVKVPEAPEKAADKYNTYSFAGWVVTGTDQAANLNGVTVTGNASYTAVFTPAPIKYTVSFDVLGTVTSGTYGYGETVAVPEAPETYKEDGVTYTFAGWEVNGVNKGAPATVKVEGNADYKAVYSEAQKMVVTYYNEDGSEVIYTEYVEKGADAKYAEIPEKITDQKIYKFIGWVTEPSGDEINELKNIQKNTAVYASFDNGVARKYVITFINCDGTEIKSEEYTWNAEIKVPDTPTYSDSQYNYTFTGWDEAVGRVKGNQTFTAQYEKTLKTFVVTLIVDGKEYGHTYSYGDTVKLADFNVSTEKADTAEFNYTFSHWTKDGVRVDDLEAETVTAAAEYEAYYTAVKQKYNVTFCDEAGNVIKTETVYYGETADCAPPAKESTAEFDYKFAGWEKADGTVITDMSKEAVKGDMTVKACYDAEKRSYTITWVASWKPAEQAVVTTKVEYGEVLQAPEGFADREATPQYKWTLTGWTSADSDEVITTLPAVTGNATYTAQYDQQLNYVARLVRGTQTGYYKSVEEAMAASKSGDAVIVDADTTISKNCTVPAGVTLMLPCQDDDKVFTPTPETFGPNGTKDGKPFLYRDVTIAEGVTLRVDGTLIVNAVTGRFVNGAAVVQDNSGGYAQLNLDGEIVVAAGGLMDVSGFVKGSGQITTMSGGTVYDYYIIQNWRGGSYAAGVYLSTGAAPKLSTVYPMNEAECHNIEAPVRVNYGGTYAGSVKMCANASGTGLGEGVMFAYTRFPLIDNDNGLLRSQNSSSYVIKSFRDGKEVYDIYGDTQFSGSTLMLLGQRASTEDFIYPFDGNNVFNINSGTTTFVKYFKFLPGAEINVRSGAGLVVAENTAVSMYKEFNDDEPVYGTGYSSGSGPAKITVEKDAYFTINGSFGGKVVASEDANITVAANAKTSVKTKEAVYQKKDGAMKISYTYYTNVYELETYEEPDEPIIPDEPDNPEVTADGVYRIFGEDRFETSMKAADALKKEMDVSKFDNIIVANGLNFPDALAGSYLAAEKGAPILLIYNANKDDVGKYIRDNLASKGTVYVLGGTGVVPDEWMENIKFKRLAGEDRFGTNMAILKEAGVKSNSDILVCTGMNFADSLSASAAGKPILLVGSALTDEQKAFMKDLAGETYYMIGGTGAVNEAVEKACDSYGNIDRLAGESRYETSVAVAEEFFPDSESAVLAYGQNFPDGLSGGPLAYTMDAPLILTAANASEAAVEYANKAGIKHGKVLGGSTLISDAVVKAVFGMKVSDKIITF